MICSEYPKCKRPDGMCLCLDSIKALKQTSREENKMKPQCTTQAECYRKYADWLEACEGTGINPIDGVKCNGLNHSFNPTFHGKPEEYEIAIGVLDGKIVWRDSVLYFDTGGECTVGDTPIKLPGKWSWTPPRQTITINGKEVAKPANVWTQDIQGVFLSFPSPEDAQQFRDALK